MSDLISREEVLNLIDTAFENGAFDGRYAYENLIDAVQNLIHPLETDLISRQAAIDAITHELMCGAVVDQCGLETAYDLIKELPSVEPERKPGKWVRVINPDTNERDGGYACSECWRACVQMSMKYCANCGCKMEVDG